MTKIQILLRALSASVFLLCCSYAAASAADGLAQEAYPSLELESCGFEAAAAAEPELLRQEGLQQQQRKKNRITDLTHVMRADLPVFDGEEPIGDVVKLVVSMDDGAEYNLSELKLIVHSGTHLDAPGHFVNEHYKAGVDVNGLDLDVLVGPVLIVDVPRNSNISAEVLEELNIPLGVQRVLFRTANTENRFMWNPTFDCSYTGFTLDGTEWLVKNRPDVKLVGTDYLSVVSFDYLIEGHRVLLREKLILVEGLNLEDAEVGLSNLYCLPLRLLMSEGSPVRCILVD